MPKALDLSEYPDRSPGSDRYYELIESAMINWRADRPLARTNIEAAIEGFLALGDTVGEARAHAKAAIVFRMDGDPGRAAAEAQKAMAKLEDEPGSHFYIAAAMELGQVYCAAGEQDAAREVFRKALDRLGPPRSDEGGGPRKFRAYLLDLLANIDSILGDHDAAIRARLQAIPLFLERISEPNVRRDLFVAFTNLAEDYVRAGRLADADRVIEQLGKRYRSSGERPSSQFLMVSAKLLMRQMANQPDPQLRQALLDRLRRALRDAITDYEVYAQDSWADRARLRLAKAELLYGDIDDAEHLMRRVSARLPPAPTTASDDDGDNRAQLNTLRALALLKSGGVEQAVGTWQSSGDAVDLAALVDAAARGSITLTLDEDPPPSQQPRRRSRQDSLDPIFPLVWAALDPERALDEVERQKSASLLRQMRWHHSAHDTGVAARLAAVGEGEHILFARPAVRSGLREAFLDYYLTDDEALLFLDVPNERLRVFNLETTREEIAEAVTRLRNSFDGSGITPGVQGRFVRHVKLDYLHELGRRLLPVANDLSRVGMLCVFPHGPLHNFPFHAVELEKDKPLVRVAPVVYGVSRRVVAASRADAPEGVERPRSAVTIGVPSALDSETSAFYGEAAFLRTIGVDATALEGVADGALQNVLPRLPDADLIHFDCHGAFSAADPIESGLLLSDGTALPAGPQERNLDSRLTVRRLLPLRLRAKLVVLRACSSGQTTVRIGDEQEGLLRAFVHAGARACVVSRWKIDKESSRRLVRRMYHYWLEENLPAGVALQRAQLDMLDKPVRACETHPYHWAPLSLVGDWL